MRKALVATAAVIVLATGRVGAQPVDGSYTVENLEGLCDFAVNIAVTGYIDPLALRDGRFITTYPGAWVTVANANDPTKSRTFNIAGVTHQSVPDRDGVVVYTYTGRNLNWDPYTKLVLIVGNFIWLSDGRWPLQGKGLMTPVCPLIQ